MCRGGRLWGAGKGGVKRLVADTLAVKGLLVAAHAVQGIGAEVVEAAGGTRAGCGGGVTGYGRWEREVSRGRGAQLWVGRGVPYGNRTGI